MARKYYFFDGAWVKNEIAVKEGGGVVRDGVEHTRVETQKVGNKVRKVRPDSALGFEGQDVHMGGEKVTVLGEIPDPRTGDITLYIQNERGGTYKQRWEKNREGGHVASEKPRRIFGGF